jgi:hypothetical protein
MPAKSGPRPLDPFDVMRTTRVLAPRDSKLNAVRWMIGEALRRLHARAEIGPRAIDAGAVRTGGVRVEPSEIGTDARKKLRQCEEAAGPAAWPILARILFEGAGVHDCRDMIAETTASWRADAIVMDRLRVALDRLAPMLKLER